MEIFPGLHWLRGGGNAYLFVSEDDCLLVDSGMPKKIDVLGYMRGLGRDPKELSHILVTHADIDHAGNVAAIQRETGAKVLCSAETAKLLIEGQSPQHNHWLMDFVANKWGGYEKVSAEHIIHIEDGETIPVLNNVQALAMPGHTHDHFSFYSRTHGILFGGDALQTRGGNLRLMPNFITANRPQAQQSAAKLLRLTPVVFACGHGKPLIGHDDDVLITALNQLRLE